MGLIGFLRKESTEPWLPLIAMSSVSGIANGALLALINAGASAAAEQELSFRLLLLFLISIAVFIVAKKNSLARTMARVEGMVRHVRVRICDKLRHTELPYFESLGSARLYTTLGEDANLISQSAFIIANAAQEAVMLVFALFYVAWLSPLAFWILAGAIVIAVVFYSIHRRTLSGDLGRLSRNESELLESLQHITGGFKELKLHRAKNDALFAHFAGTAGETERLKLQLGVRFVTDIMFSHVFFYVLIGVIVFLLPRVVPTFSEVVMKMTAAVLFIVAPLEMIVNAMPMFARSGVALGNLYRLETQLDAHSDNGQPPIHEGALAGFTTISLERAFYAYRDKSDGQAFTIGPIDLELRRGEIIFIVGGNGSGKSTLLKVLTGLYRPVAGSLRIDGRELGHREVLAWRELISAVFADFHLFDRLHGLEPDEDAVRREIERMQLSGKTDYVGGRFTNIDLSTGQRKRLALIAALLEDRPVYVFDEWAADQDAQFRAFFYETILRRLREEGKTVIAVTHDDRYWHIADQLIRMELGRVWSDERPGSVS